MARITNLTTQTLDFIVAGEPKGGVPPTGSVGPGETADLAVDLNDPVLRGRLFAGAISVTTTKAKED